MKNCKTEECKRKGVHITGECNGCRTKREIPENWMKNALKKREWMDKARRMGCPEDQLEAAWEEACENGGEGT